MTLVVVTTETGDMEKVRRDLEEALASVRGSWAADDTQRLVQLCYGLESLLRAVSTLTNTVELQGREIRSLRGRVNQVEIGS